MKVNKTRITTRLLELVCHSEGDRIRQEVAVKNTG